MHLGTSSLRSKTEAMFIPSTLKASQHPDFCQPEPLSLNHGTNLIHFTSKFKYLGSIITPSLDDEAEIKHRISKAKQRMGLLYHVFQSNEIDLKTKHLIYITGPLNTLLWGCESWSMKESTLAKLQAFHHTAIRRILNIHWKRMKDQRITNDDIRHKFRNIPPIETFLIRRTLRYLGKIVQNDNSIPRQLLGAWVLGPRKIGRPQHYCNHMFHFALSNLFPSLSDKALFTEWVPLAKDVSRWSNLIQQNFQLFNTTEEEEH